MSKIIFVAVFCLFLISSCEGKIQPQYQDFIIDYVSDEYFDLDFFEAAINYKPGGKNSMKMKLKIIKDLPEELMARLSVLAGVFGRYVPFLVQNDMKVCDPMIYDLYFEGLFGPTGIKKELCPARKGEYVNEDYYPQFMAIPDELPSNLVHSQIRVDVSLYSKADGDIIRLQLFLKI